MPEEVQMFTDGAMIEEIRAFFMDYENEFCESLKEWSDGFTDEVEYPTKESQLARIKEIMDTLDAVYDYILDRVEVRKNV